MNDILNQIEQLGVVPALTIFDRPELAEPLADSLIAGGLPCVEVTLRAPSSLETLLRMSRHAPDLLVGAGTVITTAQVDDAMTAGARFIVSPGLDAELVTYCQKLGVPIIPAATTASEIMQAVKLGLTCVKFFPCAAMGGLPLLKALNGPFPNMRFLPTGGITSELMPTYLSFKPVLAVGGTWMFQREWLGESPRLDLVRQACVSTAQKVRRARNQTPS